MNGIFFRCCVYKHIASLVERKEDILPPEEQKISLLEAVTDVKLIIFDLIRLRNSRLAFLFTIFHFFFIEMHQIFCEYVQLRTTYYWLLFVVKLIDLTLAAC